MNLTKEDLDAIGSLIDEKLDAKLEKFDAEKLEPIRREQESMRKMFTTVINLQVEITDRIEVMEAQIRLTMLHLNLSPDIRKHQDALKKLQ
ncbi:MAG: hypothetical protein WDO15_11715 [Bacteroidota bacterium]